ncbi:hypothetical protein QQP08_012951, partial [Theobroma cacao]
MCLNAYRYGKKSSWSAAKINCPFRKNNNFKCIKTTKLSTLDIEFPGHWHMECFMTRNITDKE